MKLARLGRQRHVRRPRVGARAATLPRRRRGPARRRTISPSSVGSMAGVQAAVERAKTEQQHRRSSAWPTASCSTAPTTTAARSSSSARSSRSTPTRRATPTRSGSAARRTTPRTTTWRRGATTAPSSIAGASRASRRTSARRSRASSTSCSASTTRPRRSRPSSRSSTRCRRRRSTRALLYAKGKALLPPGLVERRDRGVLPGGQRARRTRTRRATSRASSQHEAGARGGRERHAQGPTSANYKPAIEAFRAVDRAAAGQPASTSTSSISPGWPSGRLFYEMEQYQQASEAYAKVEPRAAPSSTRCSTSSRGCTSASATCSAPIARSTCSW